MYIKEVLLHNYRGFKHESIRFESGLNVIFGEGDAGKSALVKGIAWATSNAPQGKYVNKKIKTPKGNIKSGKNVYVRITFDDGQIIQRESDSSTPNIYRIGNTNTDEKDWVELKNFGNTVPDPVLEIIKLTELNIQKQFDSHFLLAQKGSEVARELNKMVNLEVIDTSTAKVNKEVTARKKIKEQAEFTVKELTVELEDFKYVDELGKLIEEANETKQSDKKIYDDMFHVNSITMDIYSILDRRETIDNINKLQAPYKAIEKLKDEVDTQHLLIDKVSSMVQDLKLIKNKQLEVDAVLKLSTKMTQTMEVAKELNDLDEKTTTLSGTMTSLRTLEKAILNVDNLLTLKPHLKQAVEFIQEKSKMEVEYDNIVEVIEDIESKHLSIEDVHSNIHELKKELGDTCPYCGNKLEESA